MTFFAFVSYCLLVTIHTHTSFYRYTSYLGVNDNRLCTQNAKRQAFWRMIPTILGSV